MTRSPVHRRASRRGFTLTELVISAGIVGVILLAGQSAVLLASATATRSAKASTTASECAAASATLAEELGSATSVTSGLPTSITCVLPDRTGDGVDDTVSYSWSGTPGDPLHRTVNGGAPHAVLKNVQSLSFEYVTQSRRLAPTTSQSAETLLASNTAPASTNAVQIQSGRWIGLVFAPSLPADVTSWSVSRVRLMLQAQSAGGSTDIQLRRVAGRTPASTPLGAVTIGSADLTASMAWKDCTFANATGLSPAESLAIVARWGAGSNSCALQIQPSGAIPAGDTLLQSSDSGASWSSQSGTLVYEVYGTLTRPGAPQTGSAYRALRIRATAASPDTREIVTTIPFVNDPPAP